jgi:nucleotide-binding universal stress UspA family protein
MSKTVLVGVDEHPTAHDAVVLGAALAAATHDELAVAHVYPLDPMADAIALGAPAANPLRDEATEIVRQAIADVAPEARVVVAPARSVAQGMHLQAVGERAEIIVVGSSHRGQVGRAALGTHSTRVVHGAPCAVAVAPRGFAETAAHIRTIAVALDRSEEAADALAFARRVATATDAHLRLVACLPPQVAEWGRYRYVPNQLGYADLARQVADQVLGVARPGEETEVRDGSVAKALIDVSQSVDLLVMGSRSYGPSRRLLLGSVSEAVVRGSHCPVVVLPRSARAESAADTVAAPAAAT